MSTYTRSAARGALIGLLCSGMVLLSFPARAEIIGTESMVATEARSNDLATVQAFMSRDEVRAELQSFGVDADAAALRVAALSDAELQQLAGRIDQQPAGAGALAVVGIVFVVLLILELVGVTNVFTRI